jgi:hypothetical protein
MPVQSDGGADGGTAATREPMMFRKNGLSIKDHGGTVRMAAGFQS